MDLERYLDSESMAATVTGPAVRLQGRTRLVITVQWTAGTAADPEGPLSLDGSVDGTHWETLRSSDGTAIETPESPDGTGAGSTGLVVSDVGYRMARLVWTRTAGDSGARLSAQVHLS